MDVSAPFAGQDRIVKEERGIAAMEEGAEAAAGTCNRPVPVHRR